MNLNITPLDTSFSILDTTTIMQYLKLDDDSDAQVLQIIRDYAIQTAQNITHQIINKGEYILDYSDINQSCIKIEYGPVLSINQITSNGQIMTKDIDYTVNQNIITFKTNISNCQISATCGYSSLSDVLPEIKVALLMHTSYLYDNRSNNLQSVPFAVSNIYNKFAKAKISFK